MWAVQRGPLGVKENITGCYKKITPSGFGVRQLAFIKAFYIEAMHFDCHYYIMDP